MANTFLSYRDQVKRIKEKGASCECKNETQCKIEENLEKLLQTNNYTRVFTPLKHTFLDIEQQELNQQVKIFNDEIKKTLFNETSTLHEKYRNLFKQEDEHKYRVGNEFFSIDFIIKTYSYDKEMQLKMWDIINNFEVILKTNLSHFITNQISNSNGEWTQERVLFFLIENKYLEKAELGEYIRYMNNIEENFWLSINHVTLSENLKFLKKIILKFQKNDNRKQNTNNYDILLKLFENFKEIKLFKEFYDCIEQEKGIETKKMHELDEFIWFLNQIRNSLAHTKTMQQSFYEMKIKWLRKKLNKKDGKRKELYVEKCNNIESIIEHNGKKIMLYSFYNKITTIHKKLIQTQASGTQTQVFRTQTQVFEKDLEKFTSEILKFGTKLN